MTLLSTHFGARNFSVALVGALIENRFDDWLLNNFNGKTPYNDPYTALGMDNEAISMVTHGTSGTMGHSLATVVPQIQTQIANFSASLAGHTIGNITIKEANDFDDVNLIVTVEILNLQNEPSVYIDIRLLELTQDIAELVFPDIPDDSVKEFVASFGPTQLHAELLYCYCHHDSQYEDTYPLKVE